VLIVDDEPSNLEVLAELLQPHYRVRAAPSGAHALRILAASPLPDLVLLDVMMPDLNGYAVLTRMRDEPRTRDLPVIFVTALGADEDERYGLDLGAVDYLAKPIRPAILLARVRNHLDLARARKVLADHNALLEAEVARRTAETRAALDLLKLGEERLRLALQAANQGIFDLDLRTGEAIVSPEYAAMLGFDPASFRETKDAWMARMHPDDREAVARVCSDYMDGRVGEYRLEFRQRTATGDWIWILGLGRVVERDRAGAARRMLGTHTDVTVRKHMEENLAASEARFRHAVEEAPIPIMIHAEDGEVLALSRAWVEISGYERGEIPTLEAWTERAYGERKEQVRAVIARTYGLARREAEGEYLVDCRDGTQRVWDFSSVSLGRLPDGRRIAISMAADVTERKRSEAQVRALNAELEERVAARTAELAAANRELDAFSYSVSHDLKAPLRGIDGYSQIVLEDYGERLDDEGRMLLGKVRHGVAQMHQLIEDLLAYSRMDRRALQTMTLDLPALVAAAVAEREAEMSAAGAVLQVDVPPCTVRADRDGLAMALRNLLGNAIKFSREARPPAIQITARTAVDRVTLCVSDNGIGFDMQFHDRIFEIFTRLQRAEDYQGTGVGLALVRRAMGRMGGRVWAESAPGQGAAFYLEIPR
jgi:hypothetical protein